MDTDDTLVYVEESQVPQPSSTIDQPLARVLFPEAASSATPPRQLAMIDLATPPKIMEPERPVARPLLALKEKLAKSHAAMREAKAKKAADETLAMLADLEDSNGSAYITRRDQLKLQPEPKAKGKAKAKPAAKAAAAKPAAGKKPVVKKPAAKKPAAKKPAKKATVDEPAEKPPVEVPAEKPTVDEPAEKPTVDEPAEKLTVDEPAEKPTVDVPAEKPTVDVPAENPTVDEPAEKSRKRRGAAHNAEPPKRPRSSQAAAVKPRASKTSKAVLENDVAQTEQKPSKGGKKEKANCEATTGRKIDRSMETRMKQELAMQRQNRPISSLSPRDIMDLLMIDDVKMQIVTDQLKALDSPDTPTFENQQNLPRYSYWSLSTYWTRNSVGVIRKIDSESKYVGTFSSGGSQGMGVCLESLDHFALRLLLSYVYCFQVFEGRSV